ncbi:flagellar hook assembly protein FlgD [Anaerobacillus arseniciselenatis]|uniref:Flagellar hook assembly protein FlgD n=1 Tax=Anaerobacillus arseniciselenatis TaxID=85682 RepID=A0A1S2LC22_9BACI|nr:flagellar hook assembly protein FlgD [Anaerobacillus arseniciselenatis]OIJ09906.1 flagellar hook assembly protein FlgD [Anaerobacillus arseniciselenatis]
MVNSINESLFLADRQTNDRKTGQSSLDQDAFLKILITQLQNQDPSNPMEDKEFISQMANFSSLEQMQQMNKSLTSFIEMQKDSHFLSQSNLIGKEIKWEQTVADTKGETTTRIQESSVKAISFQNGKTKLILEDGQAIDTKQVIHIAKQME